MTDEDLEFILRDAVSALPDSLSAGDISSLLASIAASFSENELEAIKHLHLAEHLILFSESP